ncbi:MAG: radical SAM protein [Colwellia sp.]|nr:radical SAM protein [Colwellia sp.]
MNDDSKVKGFYKNSLAHALNPRSFQLVLFPTEQCNFRCVYCYEDFEIGKMPEWVVSAIKIFLENKIPTLDRLSLSWFGGEPLLATRTIYEIAEFAQKIASINNCQIVGDVTTNGYLLDLKTLTRFAELKQNDFQISIDGDQLGHDKTRIKQNGSGTFKQIWDNLITAAESELEFKIKLRVHISDLNQKSVLVFLERYDNSILSGDHRFRLFFHEIVNLGGDQEVINSLSGMQTASQMVKSLNRRYEKQAVNMNKNGNYICYAGKPNSLAIRADGNLNKCTVALSDERNNIGKINPDGTLTINNQKFSTWIKGFTTLDSWQMGCPLSYMNQHSSVGDIEIKKVS